MKNLIFTFLAVFFLQGIVFAAEKTTEAASASTSTESTSTEKSCHIEGDGSAAQEKAKSDSKCKCVSYEDAESKRRILWADQDDFGYSYCIELQESVSGKETVVGRTGIDLVSRYISLLYKYGASIIGVICVLVIVVSGVQISMAGANSEFVNQGKERILQALLSLILLFCSALILKVVNPGFFI